MPIVRVEPLGAEIDVLAGEALAEAAWRLGYRWPTSCWGQAQCMLCRVTLLAGEEQAEEPDGAELEAMRLRLPSAARRPGVRLACRLLVSGPGLTVSKPGVRPPDQRAR
jgi:ferredoxin, 2Fe-2S